MVSRTWRRGWKAVSGIKEMVVPLSIIVCVPKREDLKQERPTKKKKGSISGRRMNEWTRKGSVRYERNGGPAVETGLRFEQRRYERGQKRAGNEGRGGCRG